MIVKNNKILVTFFAFNFILLINFVDTFVVNASLLTTITNMILLLLITILFVKDNRHFLEKKKIIINRANFILFNIFMTVVFSVGVNHLLKKHAYDIRNEIIESSVLNFPKDYMVNSYLGYHFNYVNLDKPIIIINKMNFRKQSLDIKSGELGEEF